MDYAYNDEFKDATGMDVRQAYRFMESLSFSTVQEHLVLYEAHRLYQVTFDEENTPSNEKWLPVSRPTPDFNMAMAVIDWDARSHPDAIYRIVETAIQQRVVWPEGKDG